MKVNGESSVWVESSSEGDRLVLTHLRPTIKSPDADVKKQLQEEHI